MSEPTRNGSTTAEAGEKPARAGPGLDARVFETFFPSRTSEPVPPFSSDIATAWILVQRLLKERGWVEVVGSEEGTWICRVHDPTYSDLRLLGSVAAEAGSAPLAICRAALQVVERERGKSGAIA